MLFLPENQREDIKYQAMEKKKGKNINTKDMMADTSLHQ